MKKEELYGKYQSEYQKRIIERFADTIPEYIYLSLIHISEPTRPY